jgi:hypothetical protein
MFRFHSPLRSSSSSSGPGKRCRSCRPALEELEDRRVPATAFGLTTMNGLFTFDTTTPNQTSTPVAITGLAANEQLLGIDIRPADGKLYALGQVTNTTDLRLYVINTQTGAATQVGNAPLVLDTARVTNPSDLGTAFGLDFNPQADKLRVVTSTGRNFRVDPATGQTVDADPNTPGVQFDTDINPSGQAIVALAYTNDTPGATSTTLFGYNFAGDQLVRIGGPDGNPSPNTGTTTVVGPSGISADFAGVSNLGFDVQGTDTAFANVLVGGKENLYSVNLATGAYTKVGAIGDGSNTTRDIALTPPGTPPPPVYQFSSTTVSFPENGGSATLTVIRTGDTSQAGSVTYTITGGTATNGSDYNLPTTGQVNFAANQVSQTITVPIINDTVSEPTETVKFSLGNVTGGGSVAPAGAKATLNILDDDPPAPNPFNVPPGTNITSLVQVGSSSRSVGRGRSRPIRLTFTVTNPTSFPAGSIIGTLNILTRRGRRRKVNTTRTFRGNLSANGKVTFNFTYDPRNTLPGTFSVFKG